MLTANQLKEYASIRGLSLRDIEAGCNGSISHTYINLIFKGEKPLTETAHNEIVKGINTAYTAKRNGTFERPKLDENSNLIKDRKPQNPNSGTRKNTTAKGGKTASKAR